MSQQINASPDNLMKVFIWCREILFAEIETEIDGLTK
jgi:hypothetical protein